MSKELTTDDLWVLREGLELLDSENNNDRKAGPNSKNLRLMIFNTREKLHTLTVEARQRENKENQKC